MKLSDFKKNYVFKTRIEIDDENFIELREPTQDEMLILGEGVASMKSMEKLFPDCIVSSSFTNDEGKEATGIEIYKELSCSGSLLTDILTTWLESVPFQRRLKKKEK